MLRYLIGIDDTDNLESRGTGWLSRQLAAQLRESELAEVLGITRHQLFVAPQIPYTSHNSSICMAVQLAHTQPDQLADVCRAYLLQESAAGSDVGLCLAPWPAITPEIISFGKQAKHEVVAHARAYLLAEDAGLLLEGLTGDGGGVIGALAAVGLRAGGNDGRFLWMDGLRELTGVYTAGQLYQAARIDSIRSLDGAELPMAARIDVSPWPRPVLIEGHVVLLVEEVRDNEQYHWRILSKDAIRRY
jgi:hypothetical protein